MFRNPALTQAVAASLLLKEIVFDNIQRQELYVTYGTSANIVIV